MLKVVETKQAPAVPVPAPAPELKETQTNVSNNKPEKVSQSRMEFQTFPVWSSFYDWNTMDTISARL